MLAIAEGFTFAYTQIAVCSLSLIYYDYAVLRVQPLHKLPFISRHVYI